ncbi:MAG: 3-carboxy-cis,cis-muconate cycloisomerase [Pseudomonadota bacterium]
MSDGAPAVHGAFAALFGDAEVARLFSNEALTRDMMVVETALTRAAGTVGLVSEELAARAAQALAALTPDESALAAGTLVDGLPVPALIRDLKHRLPEDLHPAIHPGSTSQDVLDTALILALSRANNVLAARLDHVVRQLDDLGREWGSASLIGRTRMQAALPILAGHRIGAWRAPLVSATERLAALRATLERVQIGGAVGDRNPYGAKADAFADAVADALGLHRAKAAWHTDRSAIAEYAGWLSMVAGALGKIGQDVALMAQQGIDEIALAGGGTSSAMPHKANPIGAENLVTLARFVATQLPVLHHALVHEQERSGSAWLLEWLVLPQMVTATGAALRTANDLIGSVERIGPA